MTWKIITKRMIIFEYVLQKEIKSVIVRIGEF